MALVGQERGGAHYSIVLVEGGEWEGCQDMMSLSGIFVLSERVRLHVYVRDQHGSEVRIIGWKIAKYVIMIVLG